MSERKRTGVVVVGSINMDMVAHGMRLPAPGETLVGQQFVMAPGGKGANQAVAAARLGAQVAFVARVGTREHGPALLRALADEGIACEGVVRDGQALPGIAVIMVASEGGENAIVYVPGSNAELSPDDVAASKDALQTAAVVVAQLEVPVPAIAEAFALARATGATTVLNAAPALKVPEALLGLSDWLVLNETEAAQLSGLAGAREAAQALLQRGPRTVVVTLGAEGVLLADAGGRLEHLPAQAVQAVDTVGAGDTFVGGLATGLAEGRSAAEALRLGQAAAAIAVSRSGVQSAMPRRAELGAAFAPRA
ncbi:ribokinase [Roseateles violae]|uniref:Ribokinase n=1 Tax=Roseateles violae TaxID=3058042 RepID=A0ABT8DXT8_9BURK|nr:ribokinase [Pelomonas sp. PFR6]MDN3921797.1 ribokinase [Pelomonas sp. PFR6]